MTSSAPNMETKHTSTDPTTSSELDGVPEDTDTVRDDINSKNNATDTVPEVSPTAVGDHTTDKDDSMASVDTNLPEIEKSNQPNSITIDKDINLQSEVNMENVTQPDTELLEELSGFSNLLNIGDEYLNSDLPEMDDFVGNQSTMEVGMDLKIAMDNAKFLEANPLHGNTTNLRESTGKRNCIPERSRPQKTGTTNNSTETGIRSPKGTVHITKHVLRKPTPEETKNKKFRCEACPHTGYSRASISIHYAANHPPCYCNTCGKVYSNPNALTRYMYVHRQDKDYECEDCHEQFCFESELAAHRMKHRMMPAFKCMFPLCGKEFRRMSELNSHVVIHSGKMHTCKKCDYETLNPRQLRDHQRSHSEEKKYKCKHCDERFKYTSGRKRHTDKYH